jgi:hypothetical protein
MRVAGWWIMTAGVFGALAVFMMDVSVSDGSGGRINNIGLIADRQNYLIAAALAVIVGLIMIVSDRPPRQKAQAAQAAEPLPYGITKDGGLFLWGGTAFPSRDEAVAHVKQRLAEHASRAASSR